MTKQEAAQHINEHKILLNKFKLSLKKLKKEIKALAVIANGVEGERTYSIGDKFRFEDRINTLCAIEGNKVAMINDESCSSWGKPVKVKNIRAITESEFYKTTDGYVFYPID